MTAIAQQVAEFVAASAPFDTLDEDALTDLPVSYTHLTLPTKRIV